MDIKLRPLGIEGFGDAAWGTHFCLFYETKEDLLNVLLGYFKAGLENHEFCLWVTPEPLSPEEAKRAVREAGPEFDQYLAKGQIEIVSYADWYLAGDNFDPQRVLQEWIHKHDQAVAMGYTGMRCTGNTFWLEKHQWDSFAKYEAEIDKALRELQIIVLCTYSLERSSARDMLAVVSHHQFTVTKRNGVWEYLESSDLKWAHDEIRQLNANLERRVAERTAQLAATNEQLRQEVTERKQAEDTLQETKSTLELILDNSPLPILGIDPEGRITSWNKAAERVFGWTADEVLGRVCQTIPANETADFLDLIRKVMQGETFLGLVRYRQEKGGELLSCSISLAPQRNGRSEPIGVTAIVEDITERKDAEEALRKSEQVLREAESLGHTGSWEQNLVTGEIFNTEENLRLFFGNDYSKGADFEDYAEVVYPDDREYVLRRRAELLEEEGPGDIEYRVVWPDGSVHVIFGRATVVRNELGQPIRVYGTNVDITERKQREEHIRQYAAGVEALAEISRTFAEAGLDYQSVLNTVARRTAELIGDSCVIRLFLTENQQMFLGAFYHSDLKARSLLGEALMKRVYERGIDTERFHKLLAGESIYIPVVDPEEYRTQVEPEFWPYLDIIGVSSVLAVPLKAQGRVVGALSISRVRDGAPYTQEDQLLLQNIADRAAMSIQNARLFEQVQGAREQLEALSRRLLEVQEAERRALTTELHDRVGQNLTGLSIILQNMKALLSEEVAKTLSTKFDDAQALVEDTTRQIRDIMAELYLPELEDYGLAVALETYAERAASRRNLELVTNIPDLAPPRSPSNVRIALFRAAQEAISNVLKHANATQLEVSLEERNRRINLTIEDNGKGFEPDSASQKEAQTWGLKIMRERIESIGGKVQIESEPGGGTRVRFEVERPS